jgi:hypothetical protein
MGSEFETEGVIEGGTLTASELEAIFRRSGVPTREQIRALVAERDQYAKNGWGKIIHESWGCGDFYGPCVHGRDPFTRCDDGCELLSPREAMLRAHDAKNAASIEARISAAVAEEREAFFAVYDAAMRALDSSVPTGAHDHEAAHDNLEAVLTDHFGRRWPNGAPDPDQDRFALCGAWIPLGERHPDDCEDCAESTEAE